MKGNRFREEQIKKELRQPGDEKRIMTGDRRVLLNLSIARINALLF